MIQTHQLHTNVDNSDTCIRDSNLTNRAMSSQCFLKAPLVHILFSHEQTPWLFGRPCFHQQEWTMALSDANQAERFSGETVHVSEMDAESGALCRRFLRP